MHPEIELMFAPLRAAMECLTAEERYELIIELTDGYCVHCGSETPCSCGRDD